VVNLEGGVTVTAWAAAKESVVEQGPFLKKLNLSWYYQLGLRGPLILIG
jgi:hypothetical protein